MADLVRKFTIPEALVPELIAAYGATWVPQVKDETGATVPNPLTKAEFAARVFDSKVKSMIRADVHKFRLDAAERAVSPVFGVKAESDGQDA